MDSLKVSSGSAITCVPIATVTVEGLISFATFATSRSLKIVQVDVEKKTISGNSFLMIPFISSIVFLEAFASTSILSNPSFLK